MLKPLAVLLLGAILGSAVTWQIFSRNSPCDRPPPVSRDIDFVADVSVAEAESMRADRFRSIETIEDTLSLPTDFAETEALYALAGRNDVAGIQELIGQADRIKDSTDRKAALSILLLRLTELDPFIALEEARSPSLARDKSYETSVWRSWARLDLESALYVAKQSDGKARELAAQALYATVRHTDELIYEQIEASLGIEPGSSIRRDRIYALADESPAAAIEFIESGRNADNQTQELHWLASHLTRNGATNADEFSAVIQSERNKIAFERALDGANAEANPEAALAAFRDNPSERNKRHVYSALNKLARRDPEGALAYVQQFSGGSTRNSLIQIVLQQIAEHDPQRALAWARENPTLNGNRQNVLVEVIADIAQNNPQLAMQEAQELPDGQTKQEALASIVMYVSHRNPADAIAVLETVEDPLQRRTIVSQLASQLGRFDPDQAVEWTASLAESERSIALNAIASQLVRRDPDRAISLIDQFPSLATPGLQQQLAGQLAEHQSIEAAERFIARYRDLPQYDRLQAAVLTAAARSDPDRTLQRADAIQDERLRDQLISTVAAQKAAANPQQALQLAGTITTPALKSRRQCRSDLRGANRIRSSFRNGCKRCRRATCATAQSSRWSHVLPTRPRRLSA